MNYADRVKDTSASVGTGPITLFGAPITGFRSFLSAFPSCAVDVPYAIDDGMGNWEIGIGSFSDSVLTRTQVLSSSSNGGLVDFVAGKKSVICTLPADLVESATNRSIAAASESAGHAVQTGLDRAATADDRIATAGDATATAADRVQTGLDRSQTGTDAATATAKAALATTKASEAAASEAAAAGSALAASGSKDAAAGSATASADSAAASSASATTAATQAGIATAKATEASVSATIATTKSALLGSVDTVTATATVALTSESAVYQMINPNGAARDVTLPTLTQTDSGRPFVVKNTGVTYALTVKNAAGTQIGPLVANGYSVAVVWTGAGWEAL